MLLPLDSGQQTGNNDGTITAAASLDPSEGSALRVMQLLLTVVVFVSAP